MITAVIAIVLTVAFGTYLFRGVVMTIKEDISFYKEEKNLQKEENYLQDLEAAKEGKLI